MIKKIVYITRTRPEYSLNAVLIKGLRENGVEVLDFYVKDKSFKGFKDALSFYRDNSKNSDLLVIGYNSPALVIFLRFFCRKKIIFNQPFFVIIIFMKFIILSTSDCYITISHVWCFVIHYFI